MEVRISSKEEEKYKVGFLCYNYLALRLKDFTFEFYKTYPIYVCMYLCMYYIVIVLAQLIINWLTSFGNLNKN